MLAVEAKAGELSNEMSDLKTDTPNASTKENSTVNENSNKSTSKKKVVKKKAAASNGNGNGSAKKKSAAKDTEGMVSLKTLCKELKIDATAARRKLREAGLKPDGRWMWKEGSGDLKKANSVLVKADAA